MCPYADYCFFKKNFLKDEDVKLCTEGFIHCARFMKGCLKGVNEIPNDMSPIDYIKI